MAIQLEIKNQIIMGGCTFTLTDDDKLICQKGTTIQEYDISFLRETPCNITKNTNLVAALTRVFSVKPQQYEQLVAWIRNEFKGDTFDG